MASPALQSVYNTIFRKNYVFLSVVFTSAFAMEIAFDNASNSVWNSINQGRQWKDLKHKYMENDDE
uniref:Complex III subunit 9 n=1 Tax=Phakopsora pachyrhizi TaxID=170000 RepID=A0A0S1MIH4_PHAPC